MKDEQIADCRRFFAQRKVGSVTFEVEDLTIPKHTGRFDFVLSVDVMEHIQDDVQVFRNFYKALKPGGGFSSTLHPTLEARMLTTRATPVLSKSTLGTATPLTISPES